LREDGAQAEGRWTSSLTASAGATAYQVRGVPAAALDARAVAINTTDGPLEKVGERRAGAADAATTCRTRAQWGADEGLRFDRRGKEIFVPTFYDVQALTVHHTAGANDDPDPAATVRAIYRYHAVDNRWGDIGYQYLVDESGVVYEGRWSGEASTSCADFAHQTGTDRMVTGAHTGGWNSGNLGIALLGDFTTEVPTIGAMAGLEDLLVDLSVRHSLEPEQRFYYDNPASDDVIWAERIGGHRDYNATECPGERLYEQLPVIRAAVAARVDAEPGPEPDPDPEPLGSVHIGDLDGAAAVQRNQWQGRVTATVLDAADAPVSGAVVSGTWTTTGSQVSCTTAADGTCTVTEGARKGTDSLTFTVSAVHQTGLDYDAAANTDPDGSSDGTSITVARSG
jgi:hypothetical protein